GMSGFLAEMRKSVTSAVPLSNYGRPDVGTSDLRRYVQDLRLVFSRQETLEIDQELAAFLPAQPGQKWLASYGARFLDQQSLPIARSEERRVGKGGRARGSR